MENANKNPKKIKKRSRLYIPWYREDEEATEDGEEDSWVNYVRRNISHAVGKESPFPESSWSYAGSDSVFGEESTDNKTDDEITQDVLDALYEAKDLDASKIKVLVLNGLVSLFGTVNSISAKRAAGRSIQDLPAVWSVRNELEIEMPEERRSYDH